MSKIYTPAYIDRINCLHQRIKEENTGTPKALANQLHTSEQAIYNLIDDLKEYGAKIKFSRKHQSFYYLIDLDFNLKLTLKAIVNNEAKDIYGGYSLLALKMQRTDLSLFQ